MPGTFDGPPPSATELGRLGLMMEGMQRDLRLVVEVVTGMEGRIIARLDDRMGRLEARISLLEDAVREHSREIGVLKQALVEHSHLIRQNTADIRELKTDVAGLKTDVAGLKTDVAGLKTDVAGLRRIVLEHTDEIRGLRADFDRLALELPLKADKAELAALEARVLSVEVKVRQG